MNVEEKDPSILLLLLPRLFILLLPRKLQLCSLSSMSEAGDRDGIVFVVVFISPITDGTFESQKCFFWGGHKKGCFLPAFRHYLPYSDKLIYKVLSIISYSS